MMAPPQKREAGIEADWERFAGMAEIPAGGLVPIEECERHGDGHATYEGECPDCGETLEIFLEQAGSDGAEWQPYAERCTRYGDGCDHRWPSECGIVSR